MSKKRKRINTTIDDELYTKAQLLAIELSAERGTKIYANDILEEGLAYILEEYEKRKEK